VRVGVVILDRTATEYVSTRLAAVEISVAPSNERGGVPPVLTVAAGDWEPLGGPQARHRGGAPCFSATCAPSLSYADRNRAFARVIRCRAATASIPSTCATSP
jgi:hypothetical protein